MKFTVDFRAADGSRQQKEIVAADRAGVFTELKKLGISAITVREGAMVKTSAPVSPSLVKGIVAGLVIVIALAGVLYLMLGNRDEMPQEEKVEKRGLIEEVVPESSKALIDDAEERELRGGDVANGEKVSDRRMPDMMTALPASENMPRVPAPPQVFEHESDQLISMVLSGGGEEIAPVPFSDTLEEDFKKSLEKPIEILDGDDERLRAVKRRVIQARQEIQEMLKQGLTVRKILEEHHELVNYNANIRREAILESRKILASGDVEGARDYVLGLNEAFEKMGIEKIDMPLTKEQRQEMLLERVMERKAMKGDM